MERKYNYAAQHKLPKQEEKQPREEAESEDERRKLERNQGGLRDKIERGDEGAGERREEAGRRLRGEDLKESENEGGGGMRKKRVFLELVRRRSIWS